jgi:hypothetical protein
MKIELSHDFLAKKIYEEASTEDKNQSKAMRYLQECFVAYRYNNKNLLLTSNDLQYLEPYLEKLEYDNAIQHYLEESQQKVAKDRKWAAFKKYGTAATMVMFSLVMVSMWGMWHRNHSISLTGKLKEAETKLRNKNKPAPITARFPTSFRTIQLKGQIKNESHQPLSSATVHILGAITKTDAVGNFELHVVLPAKLLDQMIPVEFKQLGYETSILKIDADKSVHRHEIILKSK